MTPQEALLLAQAYIQYVKCYSPQLHKEADGSPSIEYSIKEAYRELEAQRVKTTPA